MVLPVLFLLLCMKSTLSEKMSILLERLLILIGLRKEGMEDEDDPKKPNKGNKKKQCNQSNEMPIMQMPMLPPPQMQQKPLNTSLEYRELPEVNTNYGIGMGMGEPMASNEMGCSFLNY
jgi:hypothetical protein